MRARPPPAPAVLRRGRDRGGGVAPGRHGGDARDARGARPRLRRPARLAGRRDRRVPRPDRPALGLGPRGRAQHPLRAGRHARLRDRARRCGATTPSSSAGWSSASRPTSSAASSATSSPPSRSRSRRSGPASPAPTSTALSSTTSTPSGIRDLWPQHTGHGIGLRNHEAPFLDVGDHTPVEPGMVFTIEPGRLQGGARRLPALRHRRRHRGRHRDPHRLPTRPQEPHDPVGTTVAGSTISIAVRV